MVSSRIVALDSVAVVSAVCLYMLAHYSEPFIQILVGLEVLYLSLGAELCLFDQLAILVVLIGEEIVQLACCVEA